MTIGPDDSIVTIALSAYRENPLPESTSYVFVWAFDHRERMAAALNAVVARFEARYQATRPELGGTEHLGCRVCAGPYTGPNDLIHTPGTPGYHRWV